MQHSRPGARPGIGHVGRLPTAVCSPVGKLGPPGCYCSAAFGPGSVSNASDTQAWTEDAPTRLGEEAKADSQRRRAPRVYSPETRAHNESRRSMASTRERSYLALTSIIRVQVTLISQILPRPRPHSRLAPVYALHTLTGKPQLP